MLEKLEIICNIAHVYLSNLRDLKLQSSAALLCIVQASSVQLNDWHLYFYLSNIRNTQGVCVSWLFVLDVMRLCVK